MLASVGALCFGAAGCDSGSSTDVVPSDLTLERTGGLSQTGEVGEPLGQQIRVMVRDADGSPTSGVEVRFTVEAGGGSVSPATATTDASGEASTAWTLGTRAGPIHRVRASLAGTAGGPEVEFEASATPGPPHALEVVSGNEQFGQHMSRLPRPLVARVEDRFANPVSGQTVSFTVEGDEGTIETVSPVTGSNGEIAAHWVLGSALGEQTVSASLGDLTPVTFIATALELPFAGDILESVFAGEANGALRFGEPEFDPSAPDVTVAGAEHIIPGGGGVFNVASLEEFTTLYVFVGEREGYYELDLTQAESSIRHVGDTVFIDVSGTLGTLLVEPEYELRFAAGNGSGAGVRAPSLLAVEQVNTGPIQVSVAWDRPSDVDLYLVEPSGEMIYHEHPQSSTGGVLDFDSNSGCAGEDFRNENIAWPDETPLPGTYVVRLEYWSSCLVERTRWLVTVRVRGTVVRTIEGVFTGPGAGGIPDSAEIVTTFVF